VRQVLIPFSPLCFCRSCRLVVHGGMADRSPMTLL
jgi:hypothetical protein